MELDMLNKAQKEAVLTTEGPVLMLAAAGSGKTHSLIYRVAYLLDMGVPAESILLLTFTNKAADEMKTRIGKISAVAPKIEAGTFHSFCTKNLRIYGERAGFNPGFTIIDGSDCLEIMNIARTESSLEKERGIPQNKTIVAMVSKSKNLQMPLCDVIEEYFTKYSWKTTAILSIVEKYEKYKNDNDMLSYDDILIKFLSIITEHPEIAALIESHYQYIMVDEYQDTNHIQEKIIFALRKHCKNIAVVGDDSQALYAFRGAVVENIIDFPEKTNAKMIEMFQNYRSTQEILDLGNHVIENHATEGFKKHMFSEDKNGNKPWISFPYDQNEEAAQICKEIKNRRKTVPDNEICVLARGSRSFAKLEILLTKNKIPYQKFGGQKFLDKAVIKDMTCYLRLVKNQYDQLAWFRILQVEEGIGNHYAKDISEACIKQGFEELKNNRHSRKQYYKGITSLYEMFRKTSKEDDTNTILSVIEKYYVSLRERVIQNMKTDENTREEKTEILENDIEDIKILKEIASLYHSIPELLDDISLSYTPTSNDDGVVLSTIHSAKGLEFDTVFIMDCVDGLFPRTSIYEEGSKEDNEELRCMYVAITRAKRELLIYAPCSFSSYISSGRGRLSHFISDAKDLMQEVPYKGVF